MSATTASRIGQRPPPRPHGPTRPRPGPGPRGQPVELGPQPPHRGRVDLHAGQGGHAGHHRPGRRSETGADLEHVVAEVQPVEKGGHPGAHRTGATRRTVMRGVYLDPARCSVAWTVPTAVPVGRLWRVDRPAGTPGPRRGGVGARRARGARSAGSAAHHGSQRHDSDRRPGAAGGAGPVRRHRRRPRAGRARAPRRHQPAHGEPAGRDADGAELRPVAHSAGRSGWRRAATSVPRAPHRRPGRARPRRARPPRSPRR